MAMKAARRGVEQHAAQLGLPAAASVVVCCAVWALKQWKRRRQDRDLPPPAPETAPVHSQGAVGQWAAVLPHNKDAEAAEEIEAFAETQGEASSSGRGILPDPLELLLYDEVLPLSVAEVWAWTQRPLGRVAAELHIRKRNRPVSANGWHSSGAAKLQRSTEYITPLKKLSFGPSEALCCERKTLEHRGPAGFLVSVAVQTPNVPYGDAFYTRLQIWAARQEGGQTRLRITGDMCFKRKLMLAGIIRRSTFEGMKTTYELFAEIMREQLQQHQQGSRPASAGLPSLKLAQLRQPSCHNTDSSHTLFPNRPVTAHPINRALTLLQLLGILGLLFLLLQAVLGAAAPCPIHRNGQGIASAVAESMQCLLSYAGDALPDLSWHWRR
ncbi:hypothetical protein WJX74_007597 [Apatococcus lobatus]|uniref:VASt domain-containing protein n=1 Tax=Apatococcus lobatus TaxID=904363 RepID=A0AAW1QJC4_9CHLO